MRNQKNPVEEIRSLYEDLTDVASLPDIIQHLGDLTTEYLSLKDPNQSDPERSPYFVQHINQVSNTTTNLTVFFAKIDKILNETARNAARTFYS
jgi:hypothetical protein